MHGGIAPLIKTPKSGSGGPASKSVRVEMVNLLEPGTLSVWDLACGGNSEIYQGPQGGPIVQSPGQTWSDT